MSLNKKKKSPNISPKRPGRVILTNDYTGRQVEGKIIMKLGSKIETPMMSEIVPNYTKCNNCKKFLGIKEEDLAHVLDYNCIECFEIQIEDEFSVDVVVSPITIDFKIERRKN